MRDGGGVGFVGVVVLGLWRMFGRWVDLEFFRLGWDSIDADVWCLCVWGVVFGCLQFIGLGSWGGGCVGLCAEGFRKWVWSLRFCHLFCFQPKGFVWDAMQVVWRVLSQVCMFCFGFDCNE